MIDWRIAVGIIVLLGVISKLLRQDWDKLWIVVIATVALPLIALASIPTPEMLIVFMSIIIGVLIYLIMYGIVTS